jgi:hypothetical protein
MPEKVGKGLDVGVLVRHRDLRLEGNVHFEPRRRRLVSGWLKASVTEELRSQSVHVTLMTY